VGARTGAETLMQKFLLDTNVLVRFILGEPAKQAVAASRIFKHCDEGKIELVLLPVVLAETVFVLSSFYKQQRAEITKVLTHILSSPGVRCAERDLLLNALRHFAESKAHFVDCCLAASSEISRLAIASFDRDFDKLPGATRIDPRTFKIPR
jgi:predicted nucleic-acid-binding protein